MFVIPLRLFRMRTENIIHQRITSSSARPEGGVRVVLVDDHAIYRKGLRQLLEDEVFEVVGEASRGEEALALVEDAAPDVVLMDVDMPGVGGVTAAEEIARRARLVQVVMLSGSADEHNVVDAIVAGACGFLVKDAPLGELMAGVEAAARGESLISPTIAGHLLQRVRNGGVDGLGADDNLSQRETEILTLMAEGKDNGEIARELFLSPSTVRNHIKNILKKLQLETRIEAAVYAAKAGLV